MFLSMFFSKCYPTNTSIPPDEAQTIRNIPLTRFPAATQFAPTPTIDNPQDNPPYSYIKEGNIEKMLDGLRQGQYNPELAWKLALESKNSPAVYMFVITCMPIASAEYREDIVSELRSRPYGKELSKTITTCYSVLKAHSAQEAWDYKEKVTDAFLLRPSILYDAIVGKVPVTHTQWRPILIQVTTEGLKLDQPLSPPSPQASCCGGRRKQ